MLYLSLFEAHLFEAHSSPPKPYGYRWGVLLHNYEAGGTDSIYELLTSGYVPGVGPVTAKKIIKAFGADSLKIIEKSPEKLTELAGIKEKAAKKIHDAYIHIAKDQELISFLLPFISMQKINAVLKEYGDSKQALAAIKENPYCLYQDVSGIGFAASDRIALVGLGIENRNSLLKNRLQHYNNEKYLDIHMTNFGTSGTDCFAE